MDLPEAQRTVNQPRGERHRTAAEARRHVPPLHSPITPKGTRPLFFQRLCLAYSVVSSTNYTCTVCSGFLSCGEAFFVVSASCLELSWWLEDDHEALRFTFLTLPKFHPCNLTEGQWEIKVGLEHFCGHGDCFLLIHIIFLFPSSCRISLCTTWWALVVWTAAPAISGFSWTSATRSPKRSSGSFRESTPPF